MTFRHATALALVGWYLMKPPLYVSWTDKVRQWFGYPSVCWDYDYDAPMSKWSQVGEFQALAECYAEQERIAAEARDDMINEDRLHSKSAPVPNISKR
jgi:hypothetical protein